MSHCDSGIGCSVLSGKTRYPALGVSTGGSYSVSVESADSSSSSSVDSEVSSTSTPVASFSESASPTKSESPASSPDVESMAASSSRGERARPWSSGTTSASGATGVCASEISASIFAPHASQYRAPSRFSAPQSGQSVTPSLPWLLLPDNRRRLEEIFLGGLAQLEAAPGHRRLRVPHRCDDLVQRRIRAECGRRTCIRRDRPHDRLGLLERPRLVRLHRPLHEHGPFRRAQQHTWVPG